MHLQEVMPSQMDELYVHMERDFPKNELIPFFLLKYNLRRKHLAAYYLLDEGVFCGYAVIAPIPSHQCIDVEYLAILPSHRSNGYGGKLLALLSAHCNVQRITLQAEDPAFAKNQQERRPREKRIAFYKRAGFMVEPSLRLKLFGVPMLCLCNWKSSPDEIKEILYSYFSKSYKRIPTWLGVRFRTVSA